MKKTNLFVLVLAASVLFLSACGAATANESAPAVDPAPDNPQPGSATTEMAYFSTEYADATNTRNQLAYGTILLTSSDLPISVDQAKAMLPLWQAMLALAGETTTAPEEISAIQSQIISNLTPEQLTFIADSRITNANLYEYYASLGINVPTPSADTTRVPGSGKNMTEAERAARRATAEASGEMPGSGQTSKDILFQKVIEILSGIAG